MVLGRILVVAERARQRLGTDVVARHERQREQHLVLDQRRQIERRRQREDVVLGLGVERRSGVLAIDEENPPLGAQTRRASARGSAGIRG
jgi:hypothetical protein